MPVYFKLQSNTTIGGYFLSLKSLLACICLRLSSKAVLTESIKIRILKEMSHNGCNRCGLRQQYSRLFLDQSQSCNGHELTLMVGEVVTAAVLFT